MSFESSLEFRHREEMEKALEKSAAAAEEDCENDGGEGEKAVNDLAARHLEERQMAELKWESDLGHLRDTQCREFREWVMCVHEELKTSSGGDDKKTPHPNGGGIGKSESSFSIEAMPSSAPFMQVGVT